MLSPEFQQARDNSSPGSGVAMLSSASKFIAILDKAMTRVQTQNKPRAHKGKYKEPRDSQEPQKAIVSRTFREVARLE